MPTPAEKNLVLTNYNVKDIDGLRTEAEKITHLVNYLEDVNILLQKHNETIKALQAENETLNGIVNSHREHLSSHDKHLDAHGDHLSSHDKHLASHDEQLNK